jgi:hypothetical protein
MDETNSTPVVIAIFFLLRCIVPLVIMLGISYLLKKLGLISETPKPPPEENGKDHSSNNGEGGFAHV